MFNEYDVVSAKHSLGNVPKGTTGTILIIYDDTHFEVEFITNEGETIAVMTVSENDIELKIPWKKG